MSSEKNVSLEEHFAHIEEIIEQMETGDTTLDKSFELYKNGLEEIKAAGYTPMLYASTNWTIMKLDMSQLDEYPFWYAYYGDDIPDTQVLKACGVGFAPSDAVDEAKEAADIVTKKPGGHGCLREGIETILKAQGKWVFDEDKFHQIY